MGRKNMRNIWTIARREYKLYFTTPVAYMVAFLILLVLGFLFYVNITAASVQQFAPGIDVIMGPLVTLLLFGAPAITMRLIAEEQRMGTIELLLTAPVKDFEIVVGKWLGGFFFLLTLLALTWIFPIALNALIDPGIDQGPLVTGYLGLILISSALVGIGVAVSAFFSNQIAAFFTTLGVLLLLWLIGTPAQAAGGAGGSLLTYLDFGEHFYRTFYVGVIDLSDVVYYLSLTALSLFIGSIAVETRRWR
jgi:ABC-2 type transport system permease protein